MTAEELAARVREDVDRNGDLIRKREDSRAAQDSPFICGGGSPKCETQCSRCAMEFKHGPLRPSSWRRVSEEPSDDELLAAVREHTKPSVTNTPTESILGKAHRLVQGRRGAEYGHPLDNHGATAEMFAAYLQRKYDVRVPLDADDICWFNIFQKGSRDANEPGEDNLVDTAGYAFNLELIRAERTRRSTP